MVIGDTIEPGGVTKLSNTFFTLTRQSNGLIEHDAGEEEVALCTFNSRGKSTAICAEVLDPDAIEVDFSKNDCSTFELAKYRPSVIPNQASYVKRQTCVKVGA